MEHPAQDAAFREEMVEQLELAESCLLALERCALQVPHAGEDCLLHVQELFRAFHTIKGLASMVGCKDVAALTHAVESVLEPVRRGAVALRPALMDVLLAARDLLAEAVQQDSCTLPGAAMETTIRALSSLAGSTAPSGVMPPSTTPVGPHQSASPATPPSSTQPPRVAAGWRVVFTPRDPELLHRTDLLELLQSLQDAGAQDLVPAPQGMDRLEAVAPDAPLLAWSCIMPASLEENHIRDLFIFVEDAGELTVEPVGAAGPVPGQHSVPGQGPAFPPSQTRLQEEDAPEAPAPAAAPAIARMAADVAPGVARSGVHVDSRKLDAMVAMVGELVIAQSRLALIAGRMEDAPLQRAVEELDFLAAGLRDQAMAMRMTPLGGIFAGLRRLVRELSHQAGKEAVLTTSGGETELDKAVIEQLGGPLVHLLRNAVEHGLESPDAREAVGKPRRGTIALEAGQAAGAVTITLRDDGRGLERQAILAKAQARGLVRDGHGMADEEVYELLFHPDFCAPSPTEAPLVEDAVRLDAVRLDVVRLDAVRRTLDSLRGTLSIASQPGQGVTVQLKLPLTMAIIEGLQVRVGEEHYIIPLAAVEECLELPENAGAARRERLLPLRGELVPCLDLRDLFAVPQPPPAVEHVVVTLSGGLRTGLVVDAVLGQQQAVIKNLGVLLRHRTEFAGAAVQGDGSLALILDVPQVLQAARARQRAFSA